MFRHEYKGCTLRLFRSKEDAMQSKGSVNAKAIGSGWVVKLDDGKWYDAHGRLPVGLIE